MRHASFAVLFASLAFADEPVATKEAWARLQSDLDVRVGRVKEGCGAALDAKYEKASFAAFDADTDRVHGYCEQATQTLVEVCKSAPGKQAVQSKLKHVVCREAKDGTRVTFDKDTLTVQVDPRSTSIQGLKKGSYSWISALKEVL